MMMAMTCRLDVAAVAVLFVDAVVVDDDVAVGAINSRASSSDN